MKKQVCRRAILVSLALGLLLYALSTSAQQSHQFSVAATESTDVLNGQIDWPSGTVESWDGSVVLFVPAAGPSDRDGWSVRTLETVWLHRVPLRDLSAALVKQGVAVIRFDNPGVLPPHKRCRENVLKHGISEKILLQRCLDPKVLGLATPDRYWESIEQLTFQVQRMFPAVRDKLFLFGFSEGLMHAAALTDRGHIKPRGLIGLGSPAEKFESTAHWQALERVTENLDLFDANSDGVITNEEIKQGHVAGLNNFMSIDGWLSISGQWNLRNRPLLEKSMELYYEKIMDYYHDVYGPGGLQWMR